MNIFPLIEFYGRRKNQLADISAKLGQSHPPILLDLAWSIAPFLERHFPQVNDQGILDDALETLQAMFDTSAPQK